MCPIHKCVQTRKKGSTWAVFTQKAFPKNNDDGLTTEREKKGKYSKALGLAP